MYLIHLHFILPKGKSETCSAVSYSSLPLSKIHHDISKNDNMQTIIYRMDKQREATIRHKELYTQYPIINHMEKTQKRMYICITESLSCTLEVNTTL